MIEKALHEIDEFESQILKQKQNQDRSAYEQAFAIEDVKAKISDLNNRYTHCVFQINKTTKDLHETNRRVEEISQNTVPNIELPVL